MSTLADRAEAFACLALAGRHLTGAQDPSDAHVACVPDILRSLGASEELVAAGYLLGLIGDASVTLEQIEREFGAAIAALVRGVAAARRPDPVGGGRLAVEDADVQTLVLAADLATLRGAYQLAPRVRTGVIDAIRFRAARLLHAHLDLQYEMRQTLAQWQWQWARAAARSALGTSVGSPGADTQGS